MAFDADGAAANGFGRRSLHLWEARLLYEANYPAPPDFRGPPRWRLSAGGVYIPPPPLAHEMDDAITAVLDTMTDEQRALPQHFPDNYAAWSAYFAERYEREMAAYDGAPPPPPRNNAEGRRRWWSAPGRTLAAVLDHIEAGNTPVLRMPPRTPAFSRRRGSSWMPRRMASTSSSSASASRSSGGTAPPSTPRSRLRPIRTSPASTPRNRRGGGGIVIRERQQASPPRGRARAVRPNREPDNGGRARRPRRDEAAAAAAEEDAIVEAVMARSLNDLVPADNQLPMDAALAWSRAEWEREEAERQQRLLEEAARRAPARRAGARRRCRHRRRQRERRRVVPAVAFSSSPSRRRPRPEQQPPCRRPRPEQQPPAAELGRLGRRRRRRRGLHGGDVPPVRHVGRFFLSFYVVLAEPNSNICKNSANFVRTRLYIINIFKFRLSLS